MLFKSLVHNTPFESNIIFSDYRSYYEYKIDLWHNIDLKNMKASYKITNDHLILRFVPPEFTNSVKSNSIIELQDGWYTK